MKNFNYIIYEEGKFFVSQCLNVNVSSFGETTDEAIENLKEALELYYEDENADENYISIRNQMLTF